MRKAQAYIIAKAIVHLYLIIANRQSHPLRLMTMNLSKKKIDDNEKISFPLTGNPGIPTP